MGSISAQTILTNTRNFLELFCLSGQITEVREEGGGGVVWGWVDWWCFIDVKQPPKNLFNNKEESENTARRELIRVGEPVKFKETKSPTTPAFHYSFEAIRYRSNNLIGYKKVILFLLMSVV